MNLMSNPDVSREVLAADEKIALAKLEESKAAERVRELEYQKSSFLLKAFLQMMQDASTQHLRT